MTRLLEDQGIDVNTVRNHGSKIHQKIKDIVKQKTGSAKATPDNTGGMMIKVPTDNVFIKKVKQKTGGEDLGPKNLNPKPNTFSTWTWLLIFQSTLDFPKVGRRSVLSFTVMV